MSSQTSPISRNTSKSVVRRSGLFLLIDRTVYLIRRVPQGDGNQARAYRLRKADGTLYDLAESPRGPSCDCPDFIYRREGNDPAGCKHIQAMVDSGLLTVSVPSDQNFPAR